MIKSDFDKTKTAFENQHSFSNDDSGKAHLLEFNFYKFNQFNGMLCSNATCINWPLSLSQRNERKRE